MTDKPGEDWAAVMARTQKMWMDAWAETFAGAAKAPGLGVGAGGEEAGDLADAGARAWAQGLEAWTRMLGQMEAAGHQRDRRFASPEWSDNPLFAGIRQAYLGWSAQMLETVDRIEGLGEEEREKLRFACREMVDAMSPANFALTNPEVLAEAVETGGDSLAKGMSNFFADLAQGQLTQSPEGAFELGRNLATTPGKVIYETELFQLIHYAPTTATVLETPLVVFPPWINRFYILDLTPEKSFVKWAVDQGVSLFMVSWKSADASIADIAMDDYVAAQVEAIDTVRDLLGVERVHAIGYCVAGTVLAMTLALLAARGEADKVASATLFTAQVDFEDAGDLKMFVNEETIATLEQLSAETGVTDGRVLAATFNVLRGRDLVWNYVVNNYLMGKDPRPFDLLHWNGDVTNLPARWHIDYLKRLYRDNLLVEPGAISIDGHPIDLTMIETPLYVQAGEQDHIAPPGSVWKINEHVRGPVRFVLAGSGHIAGVVNPPAAGKYHYSVLAPGVPASDLAAFREKAERHEGSWWPDWIDWLRGIDAATVEATGARVPGKGRLKPIEDAPGRYVKTR
ncbi:PHA/PHB synthase family protein [Sphingomicrobium astaxanthinifaciens]|uniref:PHA/PHB synthase family protein n=1 Tax=Sphingomicrobium astaxanthinifaciens TaxID=1227949 RepID=UPI001FCB9FF1|nr:class I poly(R)-hydroxyalkanoic acid synthase [Sphingomicrobium astaxanthinifaciens]MCJ7420853.1 class I poly(R)-hydroxyalkanoic acid synthase [Sphingomicrobium astaxanthinifaciens]